MIPDGDATLKAALEYAAQGIPVFPCSKNKKPRISKVDGGAGFKDATTDTKQIEAWWKRFPNAAIGMPTGHITGVYVVDVDCGFRKDGTVKEGMNSLFALEAQHGKLPQTKVQKTGGGGFHYFFKMPAEDLRSTTSELGKDIDTRGNGGYILLPPSPHENGAKYEWQNEFNAAELPQWIIDALSPKEKERVEEKGKREYQPLPLAGETTRYGASALSSLLDDIATAKEGTRHKILRSCTLRVKQLILSGDVSPAGIEHSLLSAAKASGDEEKDALRTIRDMLSYDVEPAVKSQKSNVVRMKQIIAPQAETPQSRALFLQAPYVPQESSQEEQKPNGEDTATPLSQVEEGDNRKVIFIKSGERADWKAQAVDALMESGCVYNRGGQLVSLSRSFTPRKNSKLKLADNALVVTPWTSTALVAKLDRLTTWRKFDTRLEEWKKVDAPKDCGEFILEDREAWQFPPLLGITCAPTIRTDGTLISQPGYDEKTGIFFDSGSIDFSLRKLERGLSKDIAAAGVEALGELLCEYDFEDEGDSSQSPARSVALAAILTALVRVSLKSAPIFCFSSPMPGSGKSKIANLAAIIATGQAAAAVPYSKDEEEFRKRGEAILQTGFPIARIDNVNTSMSSSWLCSALSETHVSMRVFHSHQSISLSTMCTWLANGNNIEPQGDLTRRALLCRIDPKDDKPDQLPHTFDPVARALADRPRYLRACLAILLAYIQAGKPDVGVIPLGSFEEWSGLVRNALIWAGEPDPCLTREKIELSDRTREALREFIVAWHAAGRYTGIHSLVGAQTPQSLFDAFAAGHFKQLNEALLECCGGVRAQLSAVGIGYYLRRVVGRIERVRLADGRTVKAGIRGEHREDDSRTYYKIEIEE